MKNIFLIASPLQVICAYEFSEKFIASDNIICPIYIKGAYLRNKQIKNTIKLLKFENIREIVVGSENNKLDNISRIINFLLLRIEIGNSENRLILGDFRDNTMHIARIFFRPKNTYIIDDGFASYIASNNFLSKNIFFPNNNKLLKIFLILFFQYNYLRKTKIHIFSVYSYLFRGDIFLENNFYNIRKKIIYKDKDYDPNIAFFVGTKLSERGALSINDEIKILKSSLKYINSIGMECIYFAKRSSSKTKLDLIEKLGFKIYIPEYPLEVHLMQIDSMPSLICGFGSSVFSILPNLFPKIKYLILQYPISVFKKEIDIKDYNQYIELLNNQIIEVKRINI